MRRSLLTLVALAVIVVTVHAQSELENVLSPGRLPYLKQSTLRQLSSTDTSGGNADFIAIAPGSTASSRRSG
jgi:hypothetical protein